MTMPELEMFDQDPLPPPPFIAVIEDAIASLAGADAGMEPPAGAGGDQPAGKNV